VALQFRMAWEAGKRVVAGANTQLNPDGHFRFCPTFGLA
jgi:hypothetical protein